MQTVKSTLTKESFDNMIANNRYNPAQIIHFRDKTGKHSHIIGAGSSDYIDTFRENGITYVLTYNIDLEYISLEAFKGSEQINEIFLEGHELKEITKNPFELSEITLAKLLKRFVL